jgi:hypothetical protein
MDATQFTSNPPSHLNNGWSDSWIWITANIQNICRLPAQIKRQRKGEWNSTNKRQLISIPQKKSLVWISARVRDSYIGLNNLLFHFDKFKVNDIYDKVELKENSDDDDDQCSIVHYMKHTKVIRFVCCSFWNEFFPNVTHTVTYPSCKFMMRQMNTFILLRAMKKCNSCLKFSKRMCNIGVFIARLALVKAIDIIFTTDLLSVTFYTR